MEGLALGAGLCLAHGLTALMANVANKYTVMVLDAYIPITNFLLQCLIVSIVGVVMGVGRGNAGKRGLIIAASGAYMGDKVLNVVGLRHMSLAM